MTTACVNVMRYIYLYLYLYSDKSVKLLKH